MSGGLDVNTGFSGGLDTNVGLSGGLELGGSAGLDVGYSNNFGGEVNLGGKHLK
jgi:hypothetical protein